MLLDANSARFHLLQKEIVQGMRKDVEKFLMISSNVQNVQPNFLGRTI